MIDLKQEREFIKSLGNDVGLICDYVDYMQTTNNLRLCPRNIYCDEISNKICTNSCTSQHKGCRRKFSTCFRAYFREKQEIDVIKSVCIPACENHEGLYSINVNLYWRCPVCGTPRGEIKPARSYDGSLVLMCDSWKNPCGHTDYYENVRKEAAQNGLNGGGNDN